MKLRTPSTEISTIIASFAPAAVLFITIFFMGTFFTPALAFSEPVATAGDAVVNLRTLVAGNGGAEKPNGEGVAKLYFPRVATTGGWQTQIAVVNPVDSKIDCSLHAFANNGRLKATRNYSLGPYAREEIAVEKSGSSSICGEILFR